MVDARKAPRKPSPQEMAWIERQLAHPAPMYLLANLRRLCGPNMSQRWLRETLIQKGVLERNARGAKHREHVVSLSRLNALWPDFWFSIKSAWREAMKVADARDDDDGEEAA
jgi:hypothetical protein